MTKAQREALKWLKDRGGDGVRQGSNRQKILAGGEFAECHWLTWRRLKDLGMIEFYGDRNWRVRITAAGAIAV